MPSGEDDDEQLSSVLEAAVEEGDVRLHRSLRTLFATGFVGGADVALGVFALILVMDKTHDEVVASLAFSVGFIALTLAHSELLTENFLVPIMAVVADRHHARSIPRLWIVTGVANLIGGWVTTGLAMSGFPELRNAANEVAMRYIRLGITWKGFSVAILGGAVVTLMTWMDRGAESEFGRIIAAVVAGFLLAVGSLNHAIVVSLEMFASLQGGAPFGYLDWLGALGWATLGNIIGGTLLVTGLRLMQVGPEKIDAQRERSRPA
jgi:formate-nitrite transporter family protein